MKQVAIFARPAIFLFSLFPGQSSRTPPNDSVHFFTDSAFAILYSFLILLLLTHFFAFSLSLPYFLVASRATDDHSETWE